MRMDRDSPGRGFSWSHWPSPAVLGPFLHVCISQFLPSQNLLGFSKANGFSPWRQLTIKPDQRVFSVGADGTYQGLNSQESETGGFMIKGSLHFTVRACHPQNT